MTVNIRIHAVNDIPLRAVNSIRQPSQIDTYGSCTYSREKANCYCTITMINVLISCAHITPLKVSTLTVVNVSSLSNYVYAISPPVALLLQIYPSMYILVVG